MNFPVKVTGIHRSEGRAEFEFKGLTDATLYGNVPFDHDTLGDIIEPGKRFNFILQEIHDPEPIPATLTVLETE